MRQGRNFSPYMFSDDMAINFRLTLGKICKRLRQVNPSYKPSSRYQLRIKSKRAARRMKPGIVR